MKPRIPFRMLAVFLPLALVAGCATLGATAKGPFGTSLPRNVNSSGALAATISGPDVAFADGKGGMEQPTMAALPAEGSAGSGSPGGGAPLIIKQGMIHLLVKDTDQSIDRLTQIVSDNGGYIVSNRVWIESYREENYKYATYTIAVPADQFESTLVRLRGLSIRVVDESSTGQDVSQEYVDLQSRLSNLEATRDRIRSFLEQAQTVDESLRINQQLSDIEDQIEQVKGRMNYLSGRAAFSTIAVQLDPELPAAPTPSATPTPTPTPTPAGWDPGKTFEHASGMATKTAQFLVDAAIYLVVWIPFAIPLLIAWGVYKFVTRKKKTA
jgi:hypothetical protein